MMNAVELVKILNNLPPENKYLPVVIDTELGLQDIKSVSIETDNASLCDSKVVHLHTEKVKDAIQEVFTESIAEQLTSVQSMEGNLSDIIEHKTIDMPEIFKKLEKVVNKTRFNNIYFSSEDNTFITYVKVNNSDEYFAYSNKEPLPEDVRKRFDKYFDEYYKEMIIIRDFCVQNNLEYNFSIENLYISFYGWCNIYKITMREINE